MLPGGVTMRLGWPHFRILVLKVLWTGTAAIAKDNFASIPHTTTTHTITYIEEHWRAQLERVLIPPKKDNSFQHLGHYK